MSTAHARDNMETATFDRRVVIYDADCGMCERAMRFVRRCDWLGRLEIKPYHEMAPRFPEVARHDLDDGMQVRHTDGRVDVAIDAVRTTMLNTPLGALVGWLLFIPPIRWVGSRIYARIAAKRLGGTCALPER